MTRNRRSAAQSPSAPVAGWEVRAPDPVADRHAVFDLYAKVFGKPYFGHYRVARDKYFYDGAYDWAASRIGTVDGEIVTHFGVWNQRMRIGRAKTRVAGIGAVACRPDFRGRGLLSRTARPSLAACREAGYTLSMLFGIPDFYHRFGYVRAYPSRTFTMTDKDLAGLARAMTPLPERLAGDRRAEIDLLYNRDNARNTGTVVRPFLPRQVPAVDPYAENPDNGRDGFHGWSAPAPAGKLGGPAPLKGYVGVFWTEAERRLTVVEAAGAVDDVLGATLGLLREWGGREVVFFTLPPRGPVALRLRRGTVRETVDFSANAGPMVRALDLPAALRDLSPELAASLRASRWADWRGVLRLEGGVDGAATGESVALEFGDAGVRILEGAAARAATRHRIVSAMHLPQLLIGTHDPREMSANGTARFTGDAAGLSAVIFPERFPMVPRMDMY